MTVGGIPSCHARKRPCRTGQDRHPTPTRDAGDDDETRRDRTRDDDQTTGQDKTGQDQTGQTNSHRQAGLALKQHLAALEHAEGTQERLPWFQPVASHWTPR